MKINDITGALKAYISATKNQTVTTEVLAERTRICKSCPQRIKTRGVSRVSQLLATLAKQNNADKDISGYSCNICGCNLLLLTPSLPENLHVDDGKQKARREKTNCWMNK